MVSDVDAAAKLIADKPGLDPNFAGAVPKSMYWAATSTMANHLASALLPASLAGLLAGDDPAKVDVPTEVSDGAFLAGIVFTSRRYLFGQAVLSRSASEKSPLGKNAPKASTPSNDEVVVLKCLRRCTGATVKRHHVLQADLTLERMMRTQDSGKGQNLNLPLVFQCLTKGGFEPMQ